ncbi:SPOR domain-containing protein [Pseudoalteromonas luteoviolacea]|uniref:SPOR domain-containing protein n=1 Tax=Pseudoalteromonas luteoviolacea TaxID=43657 RepID=UPI001EED263F|nr:SPOR domain-containing protein [Pseudoalteromonas luteoviolacea]
MNSGFVNRLVGTSIIVIAAIVFIPNILDGEKVHYKEGFQQIPERPEFSSIDLQETVEARAELAVQPKPEVVEDIQADDISADTNLDDTSVASNDAEASTRAETQAVSSEPEAQKVADAPVEQVESQLKQPIEEQVAEPKKVATVEVKAPEPERPDHSNFSKMAYVIQLGSFSHKANVDALTAKLKLNGFKTFTRPVKTPNGTLTKVFVGPDLNKQKLEAKLPELKKLTKLNGRLTQFKVAK